MTFIMLSAILIALPLALNRYLGISRLYVAFGVTVLIGGPHMYATFTRTLMEKTFVKSHPLIMLGTLLVPVGVFVLGLNAFIVLLTVFFFWASIHVLHQVVYLVDCYNTKSPKTLSLQSRAIDYAVVLTSLYPIAFKRMVEGTFTIGSRSLLFPDFLRHDWVWQAALFIFVLSLVLFTAKTIQEAREGTVLWPKVLLIYITAFAAFLIPTFNDLDVAFQGMNTWHSFQYLGLTWYVNRLRSERGEITSDFVQKISRSNWSYYGTVVAMTLGAGVIILFLWKVIGLEYEQCYYVTVLSFLLMHYLHDHVLFTDTEVLQPSAA
ncbi:MAG: hypothetical protein D6743_04235 [Calditrichaeota bacterium]|nr:MAG: hypothetical protein D6743_04235 [Calditrichota bacterium]